jgi:hypothetical protein
VRLTWHLWGGVIVTALLALPLAVLAGHLLGRRRAARDRARPFRTAYADVFMVAGTLPWLWMILTPGSGESGVNLVPFRDLIEVLRSPLSTVIAQVGGNILVFAALGALLPVRSSRFARLRLIALVSAGASLTVETLQYGLSLHRVSSIDDVLLNAAGAVLAAATTRRWWARRIPEGTVPQ